MLSDYNTLRNSTNYLSQSNYFSQPFGEEDFDLLTTALNDIDPSFLGDESSSSNESSSVSTPEERASEINTLILSGVLVFETPPVLETNSTDALRDEPSIPPIQTQEKPSRKRTYSKSKSKNSRKKTKTQQPSESLTTPTQSNPPLTTFQNVKSMMETMRAAKESAELEKQKSSQHAAELEQEVASLKQQLEQFQQNQKQALEMFNSRLETFVQRYPAKVPHSSFHDIGIQYTNQPLAKAEEIIKRLTLDVFQTMKNAAENEQQLLNEITLLRLAKDSTNYSTNLG